MADDDLKRCGVKRRSTSSGWKYLPPGGTWLSNNPPCVRRDTGAK